MILTVLIVEKNMNKEKKLLNDNIPNEYHL